MKKITLATIKSFLKKNEGKIFIKTKSDFNGHTDCVEQVQDHFKLAKQVENSKYTLGVGGAWFVGSSRDRFENFENEIYSGYEVWNCCGSFIIAKPKNY